MCLKFVSKAFQEYRAQPNIADIKQPIDFSARMYKEMTLIKLT